jgi:hypothetical protein
MLNEFVYFEVVYLIWSCLKNIEHEIVCKKMIVKNTHEKLKVKTHKEIVSWNT